MAKKVAEKSAVKKAAPKAAPKTEKTSKVTKTAKAKATKGKKGAAAGGPPGEPVLDPRWQEYFDKFGSDKSSSYKMTGTYQSNQALQHSKLGWGYIVNVQNDRLEVVFQYGPRILISNYKG